MKTRERILNAALDLFNHSGEQHVTTNHIADEIDISPGNLYYHFRNKEDIIGELFDAYSARMHDLLSAPDDRIHDPEEIWLLLHLIFETIWQYRFIHTNLVDLTQRIRKIHIQMSHITSELEQMVVQLCKPMVREGIMDASPDELAHMATSISLMSMYWLNYSSISELGKVDEGLMAQGAYQVIATVSPYLKAPWRTHLNQLAESYRIQT